MKYDIKILSLTKSNLEKFNNYNNGISENFVDMKIINGIQEYLTDLYKYSKIIENFEEGKDVLMGGYRTDLDYIPDWYKSPPKPTFSGGVGYDGGGPSDDSKDASAAVEVAGAIVASAAGAVVGGVVAGFADFGANEALADSLNERSGTYTIDDYKTDRVSRPGFPKDPYIDGSEFSFIFSMFKMKMGSVLMGKKGFRRHLIEINNTSPDKSKHIDLDGVIDEAAFQRALNTTLGQLTDALGEPNKQYEGVVQASATGSAVAGAMAMVPLVSNFISTPRFEFKIKNPENEDEVHIWSQGEVIKLSPPWGRDCEDGWDWESCSCETVSTDDIQTYNSIWDTYNTNDCDYFGKLGFDPFFQKDILKEDIIVIIQYTKLDLFVLIKIKQM